MTRPFSGLVSCRITQSHFHESNNIQQYPTISNNHVSRSGHLLRSGWKTSPRKASLRTRWASPNTKSEAWSCLDRAGSGSAKSFFNLICGRHGLLTCFHRNETCMDKWGHMYCGMAPQRKWDDRYKSILGSPVRSWFLLGLTENLRRHDSERSIYTSSTPTRRGGNCLSVILQDLSHL